MTTPATWREKAPWLPIRAPHQADASARRAQEYVDVCAQFDVEHAWRYRPREGLTFCNIFVWDCTCALGCEIPHWADDEGAPCAVGDGTEMTANRMHEWLAAESGGWKPCTVRDGAARAALGFPVVAAWRNPAGVGHVAMVLPGGLVASAGRLNAWLKPLPHSFGAVKPDYFTHN